MNTDKIEKLKELVSKFGSEWQPIIDNSWQQEVDYLDQLDEEEAIAISNLMIDFSEIQQKYIIGIKNKYRVYAANRSKNSSPNMKWLEKIDIDKLKNADFDIRDLTVNTMFNIPTYIKPDFELLKK